MRAGRPSALVRARAAPMRFTPLPPSHGGKDGEADQVEEEVGANAAPQGARVVVEPRQGDADGREGDDQPRRVGVGDVEGREEKPAGHGGPYRAKPSNEAREDEAPK